MESERRKGKVLLGICLALVVVLYGLAAWKPGHRSKIGTDSASKVQSISLAAGNAFRMEKALCRSDYSSYYAAMATEGGSLAAGFLLSDGVRDGLLLTKYNDEMDIVWTAKTALPGLEYFRDMAEVQDGYIIIGYTADATDDEFATAYIVKVGKDGELLWSNTFIKDEESTIPNGVVAVEGGFVVAGYLEIFDQDEPDYSFLARYDLDGNELWYKSEPGYFNGISNVGDGLAAIGGLESFDYIYSAVELDYEGNVLSNTGLDYPEDGKGEYSYLTSFDNEYFIQYGDRETANSDTLTALSGTLAMLDADGKRVWELEVSDGDQEMNICEVREIGGELLFVGRVTRPDWDVYKGFIGKVGLDGEGMEYTIVDDHNISIFNDVVAYNGGYLAVGNSYDPDTEDVFGIAVAFDLWQ